MTITDEQVQALLDAYRDLVEGYQQTHHPLDSCWCMGAERMLEILGLSAEAERIKQEVAG